jgi:tRNA G18 (ribose-2'-O)-methylase SpoU
VSLVRSLEVPQNPNSNIRVFCFSIFLQDFAIEKETKYALVFGNEVFGVNQEAIQLCDGTIEIPQLGTKHSLNISVSAGIVIWDLFKKINYL